jgi:DnaJ-domain-containing protein 1
MSFWQIFERINRIARSTTVNSFGGRSRFDDELRRAQELIDGERRREEDEKRQKEKGGANGAKQEQQESHDPNGMTIERACAVIGVATTASMQEIQAAYRRRVAEVHPDRYSNHPPPEQRKAVARTQQLNEAYAFLKSRRST